MAEEKALFRLYSACGEEIIDSGYNHDAHQLIQVTGGSLAVSVGTEVVEVESGDFVYIPPTLVYRAESVGSRASIRALVFDKTLVEENMSSFDSEIFYMFYVQSKNKITVFGQEHPVNPTLKRFMQESYDEYSEKEICYKLPIRANIYHMMTALLRYYCGSKNELDRMIYHNVLRLRPVISYIDEHFREKIYIEELSDMINVSADYFTKMFKESIGKTPIDYINGMRVNSAMDLLCTTEMSMTEIADSIGFCNPNYFHKIFKQYMMTSPLAYRKSSK